LSALINWHYRNGTHMSSVKRGISLGTLDEFHGRTAWIANCLLMLVCDQ